MSAKKLGRFTAGLFVALGLVFGGSLLAGDSATASVAANTVVVGATIQQTDFEWG